MINEILSYGLILCLLCVAVGIGDIVLAHMPEKDRPRNALWDYIPEEEYDDYLAEREAYKLARQKDRQRRARNRAKRLRAALNSMK